MAQPVEVAVGGYLARIGFSGPIRHDVATLEALQRAHMTAVPFENLHVFHRRGVRTDAAWSVPKVVEQGRGGWCFELNGAFSTLLTALGFEVTRLAAGVMLSGEAPEAEDHLTLRVDLDAPYLVDVGFGDSFHRPLRLDVAGPQDGGHAPYRLGRRGEVTLLETETDEGWQPCFRFDGVPRRLEEFTPRSDHLQYTPGLKWTEAPFATRLVDGGPDRVWLLRDRLKLRRNGAVSETPVEPGAWAPTLEEWFGLTP